MLLEQILDTKSFSDWKKWLDEGHSLLFDRQWASSKALLLSRIAKLGFTPICVSADSEAQSRLMAELQFFHPGHDIICLPSSETLPCENSEGSADLTGLRLGALWKLITLEKSSILLLTTQSLQQQVPESGELMKAAFEVRKGVKIGLEEMVKHLLDLGYSENSRVGEKGEFAKRHGIIDLFPPHLLEPIRIEWWGDEIEELRVFDLSSQCSRKILESTWILPAREAPFLNKCESIFDYLSQNRLIVWDDFNLIEDRYVQIDSMPGSIQKTYLPFGRVLEEAKKIPQVFFTSSPIATLSEVSFKRFNDLATKVYFEAYSQKFEAIFSRGGIANLNERFDATNGNFFHSLELALQEGYHVAALYSSQSEKVQIERQTELISHPKFTCHSGYLSESIVLDELSLVLAPVSHHTKQQKLYRPKLRITHTQVDHDLLDITPGDAVVHLHHGIGIFRGVETKPDNHNQPKEYLKLEYAGNSLMYVPIENAHLLTRYESFEDENPQLHKIGSSQWKKQINQANLSIQGYARELIELYASRKLQETVPCPYEDGPLMQQFESDFPYDLTDDQVLSIEAIKKDLSSKTPMDRLICGDVGYGKTEVAMRAAFKVIESTSSQVAILAPTTVLALQHFETLSQRMAAFGIRVAVLSRFTKLKEKKEILEKVAGGHIDILIGTHRILGQDVNFLSLGLLIIDEEQRFGVKAKEHLRLMKKNIHCLTLSATPIPRTLHLSLMGGKQLSTIATPPHDRQPITTVICERSGSSIRAALLRELGRGGQAFYVRNDIDELGSIANFVRSLIPDIRIGIVHGQMNANTIERNFHDFKDHKIDLLIATTIIETGIDIPNANTLFIDPGDAFGLSDLYQLRGRVGRWNRKAYAYLILPPGKLLTEIAQKRLDAIKSACGYGAGMKVALRDLAIRGCGELLGLQQSGHVSSIGFALYCKLLDKAVKALQGRNDLDVEKVRLEHNFEAKIPSWYISSLSLRLELYQRAAQLQSTESIEELSKEIIDRYGPAPIEFEWLMLCSEVRLLAASSKISYLKLYLSTATFPATTIKQSTTSLAKPASTKYRLEVQIEREPTSSQTALKGREYLKCETEATPSDILHILKAALQNQSTSTTQPSTESFLTDSKRASLKSKIESSLKSNFGF